MVPGSVKFKGLDKKFYTVTPRERLFVETYLETINGTQSALVAYQVTNKELLEIPKNQLSEKDQIKRNKAENTAHSIANQNLRKPTIKQYMAKILKDEGYVREEVRLEHFKNIKQDRSLSSKNTAIDMFYKLTSEYPTQKSEGEFHEEGKELFADLRKMIKKLAP